MDHSVNYVSLSEDEDVETLLQPLQHEVDTRLVNPQNTFSSVPRMSHEQHGKQIGADVIRVCRECLMSGTENKLVPTSTWHMQ